MWRLHVPSETDGEKLDKKVSRSNLTETAPTDGDEKVGVGGEKTLMLSHTNHSFRLGIG